MPIETRQILHRVQRGYIPGVVIYDQRTSLVTLLFLRFHLAMCTSSSQAVVVSSSRPINTSRVPYKRTWLVVGILLRCCTVLSCIRYVYFRQLNRQEEVIR